MFGLFGRKKNTPAWASFFSDKEYSAFHEALDTYFRKTLNLAYQLQDGVIVLDKDNEFGLTNLGLDNLARSCKQHKTADYPDIVASHFNSMIEANKFQKEFEKIEQDFEQVRKYVAVRLYNVEYMACIGMEFFVSKEFAGELFAVLVFDLPYSVSNIKPEQIEPWGRSEDELFEIGLENTRKNYEFTVEAVEFTPEKDIIYTCQADHFFTANICFDLDAHSEFIGIGGSLFAAPTRNMAIVYPISDLRVIGVLNRLCVAVLGIYGDNPGSLTKEIYWYKDGRLITLPYTVEKKKINFTPPEEFVGLLNSLA